MRFAPLAALVAALVALVACVPTAGPPPAAPVAADEPSATCAGEPDLVAPPPAERGAVPFTSQAELEAARGATVYLVTSGPLPGHRARLGAGVLGLFGEPLVLCDVTAGVNPKIIADEEIVRAKNVLAKTPGGALVDVDVASISSRMPRFSLAAPEDAGAMILGAFAEARAAADRLRELPPAPRPRSHDRGSPVFWDGVARAHAEATREAARTVVAQLVNGMGEAKRVVDDRGAAVGQVIVAESGAARSHKGEDGEPWIAHADAGVLHVVQYGIPKGPVRERYEDLVRCAGERAATSKACAAAAELVADPPAIPTTATTGGTIAIEVAPARLAGKTTLEVDGAAVALTGTRATVPVATDGDHTVHATAPGMRPFDEKVNVRYGKAVELRIVFLPK
jgi:hypothetical protein